MICISVSTFSMPADTGCDGECGNDGATKSQ
jgi:hypothetical protein